MSRSLQEEQLKDVNLNFKILNLKTNNFDYIMQMFIIIILHVTS